MNVKTALLGRTITEVEVSADRTAIQIQTTTGPVRLRTGAD